MKTILILLLNIFAFSAASAQSERQTVGVVAGLNYRPAFIPYFNYGYVQDFGGSKLTDPSLVAPVIGIFYNRDFNSRFGFSVAAKYFVQSTVADCRGCRFVDAPTHPLYFKAKTNYVEVPLNVAINLNKKESTTVRSYFTFGYAYNHLLRQKRTNLENDQTWVLKRPEVYLERNTHALTGGFEFRYYKDKLMLGFAPYLQIPFNKNVEMRFIGLQIKAGRNFLID